MHLINEQIKAPKVMLLDSDGAKLGQFLLKDALKKAQEKQLDLVQLAEKQDMVICKIMNYESWLYHRQKEKHKQELKNRGHEIKIMQFRPVIGDNDFNLKIKKITEFLEDNHRVKIVIKFKNYRESTMQDLNNKFIEKILNSIETVGTLDSKINSSGKDLFFIIKPSRKPTQKVKFN